MMRKLCPHEDIDTLADALAVACGHLVNAGNLELDDETLEMLIGRAEQYDEDDYAGLFEAALSIMARAGITH